VTPAKTVVHSLTPFSAAQEEAEQREHSALMLGDSVT
jgi:hypothetical protein